WSGVSSCGGLALRSPCPACRVGGPAPEPPDRLHRLLPGECRPAHRHVLAAAQDLRPQRSAPGFGHHRDDHLGVRAAADAHRGPHPRSFSGQIRPGLRIVRDDGGAVRLRHSFIRALLWPFEILSTGGGIAALSGLVSPQAKRLGDYLAGTMAVSERSVPPPPVHTHVAPHLQDWLSRTDVSALPDGLHRRIVTFLAMAPKLSIESRWQRAIELATELNPYVAPAPPEGTFPEQFLSAIVHRQRAAEVEKLRR